MILLILFAIVKVAVFPYARGTCKEADMNSTRKPVAVVIGATSKWQSDGRNTKLAHGTVIDDSDMPVGARWGVGGAVAQKFAQEGFFVVLTTRHTANASGLEQAIREQGGDSMIVELDLVSSDSISKALAQIRDQVGDPGRRWAGAISRRPHVSGSQALEQPDARQGRGVPRVGGVRDPAG